MARIVAVLAVNAALCAALLLVGIRLSPVIAAVGLVVSGVIASFWTRHRVLVLLPAAVAGAFVFFLVAWSMAAVDSYPVRVPMIEVLLELLNWPHIGMLSLAAAVSGILVFSGWALGSAAKVAWATRHPGPSNDELQRTRPAQATEPRR
jgi:hypothetical protein